MVSTALTYGPILFGGAVALVLSGIVAVQCILFFKLFPSEARFKTAMVATVWALDVAHSTLILISLFHYFIVHFGNTTVLLSIPWCVHPSSVILASS
ncbi:hypothetical protein B0H17DRAFT_1010957 [Mycena rosella]|uniref:Uncharacterized protein n=1 Tax=Mycena rosella TaxID=1033263 RepID=A0AAD7DHK1_MYCRO|nr:hypothetical protein B0H17DRAFT_1010957 [Mycena rosella]